MFSGLKFLRLAGLITLCLAAAGVAQASFVVFEVSTVTDPTVAVPFDGQGLAVSWTMTHDVPSWTIDLLNLYKRTEILGDPGDPGIPVDEVPLTVQLRRGAIGSAPIAQGTVSGLGAVNSRVSVLGGSLLQADTYYLLVYPSDIFVPYSTSWGSEGSATTLTDGVTMGSDYFVELDGSGAPVNYVAASLGLGVSLVGTPEPATYILLGVGLFGLGVWRRRRA